MYLCTPETTTLLGFARGLEKRLKLQINQTWLRKKIIILTFFEDIEATTT